MNENLVPKRLGEYRVLQENTVLQHSLASTSDRKDCSDENAGMAGHLLPVDQGISKAGNFGCINRYIW